MSIGLRGGFVLERSWCVLWYHDSVRGTGMVELLIRSSFCLMVYTTRLFEGK